MDTSSEYFDIGDEELQVWVYEPPRLPRPGYIKGVFSGDKGAQYIGVIQDWGSHPIAKINWTETVLQQMAESLMDVGVIMFLVHVKTTTELPDRF